MEAWSKEGKGVFVNSEGTMWAVDRLPRGGIGVRQKTRGPWKEGLLGVKD